MEHNAKKSIDMIWESGGTFIPARPEFMAYYLLRLPKQKQVISGADLKNWNRSGNMRRHNLQTLCQVFWDEVSNIKMAGSSPRSQWLPSYIRSNLILQDTELAEELSFISDSICDGGCMSQFDPLRHRHQVGDTSGSELRLAFRRHAEVVQEMYDEPLMYPLFIPLPSQEILKVVLMRCANTKDYFDRLGRAIPGSVKFNQKWIVGEPPNANGYYGLALAHHDNLDWIIRNGKFQEFRELANYVKVSHSTGHLLRGLILSQIQSLESAFMAWHPLKDYSCDSSMTNANVRLY